MSTIKYLLFLLTILLLSYTSSAQSKTTPTRSVAVKNEKNGYKIEIFVKYIEDSVAYLGYHYGEQKYARDTARVERGGWFVFEDDKNLEPGLYFFYAPKGSYFEFIVNEQNFKLETDSTNIIGKMKIFNSPENKLFYDFQRYMEEKQKEVERITKEFEEKRKNPTDSVRLVTAFNNIDKEVKTHRRKIANENPTTFLAKAIWLMERPDVPEELQNATDKQLAFNYYKQHFWDKTDFSNSDILRSPFFHQKLKEYVEKLTYNQPDSAIATSDFILAKAKANKDVFRYCLVTLANHYERSNIMGLENAFVHIAEKYYLSGQAEWADSTLKANLYKRVTQLKPNMIGQYAPQMLLKDTAMRNISLRDLKADYIILFFYDPGCGHCKKTTPILLAETKKMKEKGFDVKTVAISTILDVEEWKKFVREYGIGTDWINAADPYYTDRPKEKYDVQTTPMVYLLDKNQKIIGRRLEVESILGFLENNAKK
jgi:peroxiredoxin